MTAPGADTELALLLDVGSAWTKGTLIGRVRGSWRVVAHAAHPTAWGIEAIERTLRDQLHRNADTRLTGQLPGLLASIARIECHTARRAARLAVVAVSRDLSGAAARRAAESAGWTVEVSVTLDDGRALAERLAALGTADVDAWLVAGGFDDGLSPQALEAAALVAAARRPGGGPVIWAGSEQLAPAVTALFEDGAVTVVPNPRPDARGDQLGPLRDWLEELLRRTVEPDGDLSLAPVALRRAVRELSRTSGLRIAAVDIGASHLTQVEAAPDGTAASRVYAAGGLSGAALTEPGASGRVARVLGEPVDELAVADALQNQRARPATVPHTEDELAVVQAAARTQLSAMLDEAPLSGVDLVIGAGRVLAAAPHPSAATQILLDGLRPVGITQLALDAAGILPPIGALADHEIAEGLGLLGEDLVVPLGTAVVCRGGEPGRVAMRVTVHRAGWPDPPPVEVRSGQLQVLPLARGVEAELTVEPADGVSLGAPRRSARVRALATGGITGLVLDARGVPLGLPRRADDRRAVVGAWRDAMQREHAPLAGVERVR